MKVWRMAAMAAALLAAAGFWAALAPAAHGQAKIVRTQSPKLEILRGGSRIGVSIRDVEEADKSTAKGATSGVVVEEVATESPAEKAGIRKGDVIVEFDGERVRSARQLTRLVQETPTGRSVPATLLREGQRTTVNVTPNETSQFSFDGLGFDDLGNYSFRIAPRIAVPTPPTPPKPPRNLEVRRSSRLRESARCDGRYFVAAAGRILWYEGRRAGHFGVRQLGGGQGGIEGRRRDYFLRWLTGRRDG